MIQLGRRGTLALATALFLASCTGQSPTGSMLPGTGSSSNLEATAASATHPQANVRALCPEVAPGYARCFALVRTDLRYATPPAYTANLGIAQSDLASAAASAYYGPLGPAQIQQAYHLPSATAGQGQTVGIVDAYDDPTAESDLAQYRAQLNLPPCNTNNGCFQKINQNGATSPLPKPNAGWAGEISLDLDMVSAVCPNCHIVLVEASSASNKDLGAAVKAASKAGARQISNSYGGPECFQTNAGKTICSAPSNAADYNIPKTIITASAGDSSWFAGPQSPADYGTVVSVGGTSIYPYANQRGWLETAWTDGGSSCSKYVKNPSWIPKSIGCPGGTRPIADVSAVADPFTGVLVYQTYPEATGSFGVYGGTSVSSPIIAAVYALAGNAASLTYGAKLYTSKGALTDVLIGKNGILGYENDALQQCQPVLICSAVPGYDGPTGNGTPNGVGAF